MDSVLLKELGTWGLLVLIGVIGGTQALKPTIKKSGGSDLWVVALPSVLAAIGSGCLVYAGEITLEMAPLIWFVVSFAGPVLYMYVIKPLLKKFKVEQE